MVLSASSSHLLPGCVNPRLPRTQRCVDPTAAGQGGHVRVSLPLLKHYYLPEKLYNPRCGIISSIKQVSFMSTNQDSEKNA